MAKSKRVKVIHTAKVASLVGRHQEFGIEAPGYS